jgi:hypothetical protein
MSLEASRHTAIALPRGSEATALSTAVVCAAASVRGGNQVGAAAAVAMDRLVASAAVKIPAATRSSHFERVIGRR